MGPRIEQTQTRSLRKNRREDTGYSEHLLSRIMHLVARIDEHRERYLRTAYGEFHAPLHPQRAQRGGESVAVEALRRDDRRAFDVGLDGHARARVEDMAVSSTACIGSETKSGGPKAAAMRCTGEEPIQAV